MRKNWLLVVLLLSAVNIGCGKDDPGPMGPQEMVLIGGDDGADWLVSYGRILPADVPANPDIFRNGVFTAAVNAYGGCDSLQKQFSIRSYYPVSTAGYSKIRITGEFASWSAVQNAYANCRVGTQAGANRNVTEFSGINPGVEPDVKTVDYTVGNLDGNSVTIDVWLDVQIYQPVPAGSCYGAAWAELRNLRVIGIP